MSPTAKRVLVVDDSAVVRHSISAMLLRLGYQISEAHDGDEALRLIASQRPDLVILDLYMPNKDGFETLAEIRANPALQDLTVFILTTTASPDFVRRAASLGVTDYLIKSKLNPRDLRTRLGQALGIVAGERAPPQDRQPLAGTQILLVQKSSQEQRILVGLLADWECAIMPTDEPSEVLMLADEGAVDVALVDDSEDFDAFAVADSLRSSLTTAGANLPIVLMTRRDLGEVRTEGLKAGIVAYLAKPVDADRLFQTLSGLADICETPQGRPALFDPDGIWEMSGEDAQLLERMLGLFERDAPILIEAIQIAVADGDAQGLRTGAHTLKGMLATICAETLTESAGALETFGVEGRAADAAELLEEFERQMTALSRELSSYYDR